MGLLDELVREGDLDPEVMRQTGNTYQNLSELEKIQRLLQMDLLDEFHQGINKIEQAIKEDDGEYLVEVFERAKKARDSRFADPDLVDNSEV